ncbi:MAG: ATP-binding cassette domain-containing protein [Eubacteriales bacterium]
MWISEKSWEISGWKRSLRLREGVTGTLGASGCGKSMTLRCIAGIVKPDEGYIELDGRVLFDSKKNINLRPEDRHVGLLFQNYALFPNMTVRQNLMTGLKAEKTGKKEAEIRIQEMLEKFELKGLEKHKPAGAFRRSAAEGGAGADLPLQPPCADAGRAFFCVGRLSALEPGAGTSGDAEGVRRVPCLCPTAGTRCTGFCDRVCVMDQGSSSPVIPVKQLFEAPKSRAAALLSGCKNFAPGYGEGPGNRAGLGETLFYSGEHPGTEDVRYVGVRSHYIGLMGAKEAAAQPENTFRCRIDRVIDDVFSTVLMVTPEHAENSQESRKNHFDRIRVEITKEHWREFCEREFADRENPQNTLWLHVNPADVMVLR